MSQQRAVSTRLRRNPHASRRLKPPFKTSLFLLKSLACQNGFCSALYSLFTDQTGNIVATHNPRLSAHYKLNYFSSLLHELQLVAPLDTRKIPGCYRWFARRQSVTTQEIFLNTQNYQKNTQSSYSSQGTEPLSEAQWLKF